MDYSLLSNSTLFSEIPADDIEKIFQGVPSSGALASAFMFGYKNRFPVNVVAVTNSLI